MTTTMVQELWAPSSYIVSEHVIREVVRLDRTSLGDHGPTVVSISHARRNGKRSLLGLAGLGKEVWAGVDPKQYVRGLRDEWNDR